MTLVLVLFCVFLLVSLLPLSRTYDTWAWAFVLIALGCVVWVFSLLMVQYAAVPVFWVRACLLGPMVALLGLHMSSISSAAPVPPRYEQMFNVFAVLNLIGMLFTQTPYLIVSSSPAYDIVYHIPGYLIWSFFVLVYAVVIFWTLYYQYRNSGGATRLRFQYLLGIGITAFAMGFTFNVIVPFISSRHVLFTGFITAVLAISGVYYVYFTKRLNFIRDWVHQLVFHGMLMVGFVCACLAVDVVWKTLMMDAIVRYPYMYYSSFTLPLLGLPFFEKVLKRIIQFFYVDREEFYSEMTTQLMAELSSCLDVQTVVDKSMEVLVSSFEIEFACCCRVIQSKMEVTYLYGPDQFDAKRITLIDQYLNSVSGFLNYDDIRYDLESTNQLQSQLIKMGVDAEFLVALQDTMLDLGVRYAFDLNTEAGDEIYILLGLKATQDPLSNIEIRAIQTLQSQFKIMIQKCFLFEKMAHFHTQLSHVDRYMVNVLSLFELKDIFREMMLLFKRICRFEDMIFFSANESDQCLIPYYCSSPLLSRLMDVKLDFSALMGAVSKRQVWLDDHEFRPLLQSFSLSEMGLEEVVHQRSIMIPLFSGYTLVGAIWAFLNTEDLDLLDSGVIGTLVQECAVSVRNKLIYKEAQESKAFFESIINSLNSALFLIDEEGIIQQVNQKSERFLGLPKGDIEGQSISLLNSYVSGLEHWQTLLKRGKMRQYETVFRLSKFKRCSVTVSTGRILIHDVPLLMITITDLTTIKMLQKQSDSANRLSVMGRMAAGIAHEIKNPLTSMKLFSDMLVKNWSDPTLRERYVDIVEPQTNRIKKLCQNLATLGEGDVRFCVFNFTEMLTKLREFLRDELSKYRAEVEWKLRNNVAVNGDADQLEQVLLNLLINACHALPQPRGGFIRFVMKVFGGSVFIVVEDTGHGISRENLTRIFDPFYTTKSAGTGLGLSVVIRIIQAHNGLITVKSTEGKGTRFILRIPLNLPGKGD